MIGLLRSLARFAFRRGMRTGSRDWIFFSLLFGLLGRARKRAEEEPKVIHREVLEPGQALHIEVFDPPR